MLLTPPQPLGVRLALPVDGATTVLGVSSTQAPSLTPRQLEVARHLDGPALVLGAAGSGKSEALARRLVSLVEAGAARPEQVLVLTRSPSAADLLRARAEELLDVPFEELWIHPYAAVAERLLREHAVDAGLDPFFETVTIADRLAMLLDRVDELPLRLHEIRGNPGGLLARMLQRIDVFKSEAVSAAALRSWASEREREAPNAPEREAARRQIEFAELYERHDRILGETGSLDAGDLLLALTRLLRERPDVRARLGERFPHVMADELEDTGLAHRWLLESLSPSANLTCTCDDLQSIHRFRAAGLAAVEAFRAAHPDRREIVLEESPRSGSDVLDAAAAVAAGVTDKLPLRRRASSQASSSEVRFWRCRNERAQAQAVARRIERLLAAGESPNAICVAVGSLRREGNALAAALEERSVPFRVAGSAALFQRPEVRDAIAWLRMLADPGDAAAVVRALTRPPVELRSVDVARCTTIARRRKLDMISALEAGLESPQLPPEARDRIQTFLKLYRAAAGALEELRADVFVRRLIERIGLRRHRLFAAHPETAERLVNLSRLAQIATAWTRREPRAATRDFVRYLAAVADAGDLESGSPLAAVRGVSRPALGSVLLAEPGHLKGLEFEHLFLVGLRRGALAADPGSDGWIPDALLAEPLPETGAELDAGRRARLAYTAMTRARHTLILAWPQLGHGGEGRPSAIYEAAREALGATDEVQEEELFGPAEGLHATYRMVRDEVLEASWRAGSALSDMRLDTAEDVNRAVVRFLELVKLAALVQRPGSEPVGEALGAINELLGRVATEEQRAALLASALDEYLLEEEREGKRRRELVASRDEPSLEAFIPRRGAGLALSASDLELYRQCPLKYKFARVFAIPQEPTINQRFGIVIHQVLERFHAEETRAVPGDAEMPSPSLRRLLMLFEAAWRRQGFGSSDDELQYRDRAVAALTRYHERHCSSAARPVWLERGFAFALGPHQLRGRIDRVDRLPDGGFELIDYKTGERKSASELADDLQLALYHVAAREAWNLEAERGSYYYVLEDEKVPVPALPDDRERVERTVLEVGEGIQGQDFEPRPSYELCSWCDYRVICPASEA
jgi:DNA helicase-2/ATP-dependent DNA helicase PcrA